MIAVILFLVAIAAMIAAFTGVWPPKSKTEPTVAERWQAQTSATPMVQRASGLKVEKLGAPTKQGEDVVVRLKVTNQVQASAVVTGTAIANAVTPTAGPANLDSASIRVLFYNVDDNGNQMVIGGTVGSVVDLPYGESREIEVPPAASRASPTRRSTKPSRRRSGPASKRSKAVLEFPSPC